jgi:hypothetical protein
MLDMPQEENRPLSSTIDFWTEWNEKDKKTDYNKAVENYRKQTRK